MKKYGLSIKHRGLNVKRSRRRKILKAMHRKQHDRRLIFFTQENS